MMDRAPEVQHSASSGGNRTPGGDGDRGDGGSAQRGGQPGPGRGRRPGRAGGRPGRPGGGGDDAHVITEARIVAAQVLEDLRSGDLLDPSFERRAAVLDPRDRRWTRELLWGLLRRRAWIDAVLTERVRGGLARLDPDLADLLRLGVQQLLHMGSVPPYAAIAQTVELAKRRHGIGASKLANAVLRRIDRDGPQIEVPLPADPIDALALQHSHPRWIVQRWVEQHGEEEASRLLAANNREASVHARPWGVPVEELAEALNAAGVNTEPSPFLQDGLQLGGMSSLTELGAFRQGQFFVQDPAATLVTVYAAVPHDSRVADLCGAPGGKALELARTARVVVAGDRSESRLRRVAENLERLRATNVLPVCADAAEPAVREVDAVLLDVPCTGTGTFRRHPDARWRLRQSDIAVLGALQRRLLAGAAAAVRKGGLMIYSTCSLEPEENDVQVQRFLAENPDWRLDPPHDTGIPADMMDGGVLRVLPQRHGVDGAFAARLRRVA